MEEFIGIKSFKAKGKRLSNREIESYQWLEPIEPPEPEVPETPETPEKPEVPETPETPETPEGHENKGGGEAIQMELF